MNNSIHHPQVTVILPVYNAEKYVYDAIESILKQTFTDFELLIFNDCSTDASRNIILSFQDSRIRLIDSPVNTGYVKHLNEGLKQAQGKYIARMDADDIAAPDRFMKQLHFLDQHIEVAACGSWIEFIGSQVGVLEYPVDHKDIVTQLFLFGNAMAHPAVMMRRSVLIDHELRYEERLEPAEDYELWYRISKVGRLHNIPDVLLKYRMHDRNESVVKKEKQNRAVVEIRDQLLNDQGWGTASELKLFIYDQLPKTALDSRQLTAIRKAVLHLLSSGNYNNQTIKVVLSHRFVAWCKASNLPGIVKMLHYLRFPKHFFSVRICLSLVWNK